MLLRGCWQSGISLTQVQALRFCEPPDDDKPSLAQAGLFLIYPLFCGCGRPSGSQAKAKDYLPWGKCHINNEKAINGLLYIPKLVLHFLSQISSLSDPISNDDSGMLIDASGTAKGQGGSTISKLETEV